MKTFAIYHNPKPYEAVKNGFSWPGFFLNWMWAVWKHMAAIALLLFIAILGTSALRAYFEEHGQGALALLCSMGTLAAALLAGFRGNVWRKKALVKRGYELTETLPAESPEDAISRSTAFQGGKPAEVSDHATAHKENEHIAA